MKVEVKETQSNEVDWSKNTQLVYSKHENTIVMAVPTKEETDVYFHGIVMCENNLYKDGYFAQWHKKDFVTFHGTITIQND